MKRLLAVTVALLLLPTTAWTWSSPGHQAIAEVAQARLSPTAQAALARIIQGTNVLAPGALASVATWPDDIRQRAARGTSAAGWNAADVQEADRFNSDHPTNAGWHFVNLPLGATGYPASDPPAGDPMRAFVGPDDIVHALARVIVILETLPADFSKRQAVRWLVHLVGDLHQSLHVTTGYYNPNAAHFATKPVRIDAPTAAAVGGVLGDRGANGLLFSVSESNNLHAVWDRCLPGMVAGAPCSHPGQEFTALAHVLTQKVTPAAIAAAATPGDHHTWAVVWATESLQQAVASHAYPGSLKNGKTKINAHTGEQSVLVTIASPTKAAYTQAHEATASDQLVRASVRLADLLNAITWK